jgi:hypothetical protein
MTVIGHPTTRVYDLDVFVREAGDPGRQTAVLLHGFPASSRQYVRLIGRRAGRWHVVAPGYPASGYPTRQTRRGSPPRSGPRFTRPRPPAGRCGRMASPAGLSPRSASRWCPSTRAGCRPVLPEDPAPSPSPAESGAGFLARLDKVRAAAEAAQAAGQVRPSAPVPEPRKPVQPSGKPDLSRPGALTESLRAMGLMQRVHAKGRCARRRARHRRRLAASAGLSSPSCAAGLRPMSAPGVILRRWKPITRPGSLASWSPRAT